MNLVAAGRWASDRRVVVISGAVMAGAVAAWLMWAVEMDAHRRAVSPAGSDGALMGVAILGGMLLLGAAGALVAGLAMMLFRATRVPGAALLTAVLAFILGLSVTTRSGWGIRRAAFLDLAERSKPVVTAIERFQRDHGAPPQSIADLVPRYLPAIPETGMGEYPEYHLVIGEEARRVYFGNAWALYVSTPSGGINFDVFVYVPNRNYPREALGGVLEPMGEWAYVHE